MVPVKLSDEDRVRNLRNDLAQIQTEIFLRLKSIGLIDPPIYEGLQLHDRERTMIRMMMAAGGVGTTDSLYDGLYMLRLPSYLPEPKIIDVHICNLRKKLTPNNITLNSPAQGVYRISSEDMRSLKTRERPSPTATSAEVFFFSRASQSESEDDQLWETRELLRDLRNLMNKPPPVLYDGVRLSGQERKTLALLMSTDGAVSKDRIYHELHSHQLACDRPLKDAGTEGTILAHIKTKFQKAEIPIEIINVSNIGWYLPEASKKAIKAREMRWENLASAAPIEPQQIIKGGQAQSQWTPSACQM